jgi:hypothetical protein
LPAATGSDSVTPLNTLRFTTIGLDASSLTRRKSPVTAYAGFHIISLLVKKGKRRGRHRMRVLGRTHGAIAPRFATAQHPSPSHDEKDGREKLKKEVDVEL